MRPRFRGGKPYNRPLGCVRFAVRVAGKYPGEEVESWLGVKGGDEEQTGWPVVYHGTKEDNVLSILRIGFDLTKGKGFAYGPGIYCTPNPPIALGYGQLYHYQVSGYLCSWVIRVKCFF